MAVVQLSDRRVGPVVKRYQGYTTGRTSVYIGDVLVEFEFNVYPGNQLDPTEIEFESWFIGDTDISTMIDVMAKSPDFPKIRERAEEAVFKYLETA